MPVSKTLKCSDCNNIKPITEFNKSSATKTGLQYKCKACEKAYKDKNREKRSQQGKEYRTEHYDAERERIEAWRVKNKDKTNAMLRAFNKTEEGKLLLLKHRPRKARNARKSYYRNKASYYANNAKRRARQLQATPQWADSEKIKEIYEISIAATELMEPTHVDHIVPLQGKNVCGLHVEYNLQILIARANLSKGNSHACI